MSKILRAERVELSERTKGLVLEAIKPMVEDMVVLLGLVEGNIVTGYNKKSLCKDSFELAEGIDVNSVNGIILKSTLDDIIEEKFKDNFDTVMGAFPIEYKEDFYGVAHIAHEVLESLKDSTNYVHFINKLNIFSEEDIIDYKKSVMQTTVDFVSRYIQITDSDKEELLNLKMVSFDELDKALSLKL